MVHNLYARNKGARRVSRRSVFWPGALFLAAFMVGQVAASTHGAALDDDHDHEHGSEACAVCLVLTLDPDEGLAERPGECGIPMGAASSIMDVGRDGLLSVRNSRHGPARAPPYDAPGV